MKTKSESRTASITGAFGGMGYDKAQEYLRHKNNVVLDSRNSETVCADGSSFTPH